MQTSHPAQSPPTSHEEISLTVQLCPISSRRNFTGQGSSWGRWIEKGGEQLLLFVYATQQHARGRSSTPQPPHQPLRSFLSLISEGWGCLSNSSKSSQCPARRHLSPQECGQSQQHTPAFVWAEAFFVPHLPLGINSSAKPHFFVYYFAFS